MLPIFLANNKDDFSWIIITAPFIQWNAPKNMEKFPEQLLDIYSCIFYDVSTNTKQSYLYIKIDKDWHKKKITLEEIEEKTLYWLNKDKRVCTVGCMHTITLPCIKSYKTKYNNFGIIHFDAHSDLRNTHSCSKLDHACVMRRIIEENIPFISIGVRAISQDEYNYIKMHKLPVIFAHQFNYKKFKNYLKKLPKQVYISFDCDFLDPKEAPNVSCPEPGGMSYIETIKLFEIISKEKDIIGMDFVEGIPAKETNYYGIITLANLLYKMLMFALKK